MTPYPTNEFKINKFAAFLATSVKTVESIKRYCGTICQQHELQGFKPFKLGVRYYKNLMGIRKNLRHRVKKAQPLTKKLLSKIHDVVDFTSQKQFVVWITLITGFFLLLRKSN